MAALIVQLTSLWACGQADVSQRQAYLAELKQILPVSKPWSEWLERSGELPPNFGAMPSIPGLPDPLEGVASPVDWPAQRARLKALVEHWIIGTSPPPPVDIEATVLQEREEAGAISREIELRFGPDRKAKLWIELLIPKGDGPFPVFLTQENHRAWGLIALRRGYIACVYAGADTRDDTGTFVDAYPGYDWSKLTRRAWAAGRCIDYLMKVPQADVGRIAIAGHSRNGKQALIAGALDERIRCVISSSSGAGGSMPARYCSEQDAGEGIEPLTRAFPDWMNPRFRFFVGREDKLPVDLHTLVALSAPRACLLSIAINDGVENSWAMQQTYLSVKPVYTLLGAPNAVRILWRPGSHETWPTTIERFMDWCDMQLRGAHPAPFPERFIHPWDWEAWRNSQAQRLDPSAFPRRAIGDVLKDGRGKLVSSAEGWTARRNEIREAVRTVLGTPPPTAANPRSAYGEDPDHIEKLLARDVPGEGLAKENVVFGDYLNADVYRPSASAQSTEKLPAILWLHPACTPRGYVAAYRRGEQPYRTLARAGFAVFCYDQVGYGRRVEEVEGFYDRYPHWSLLGHMVRDAQAALDAMAALPYVDPSQIYVVGYGQGAMVALHLCALDDRPAGLVAVCGPQPFRLDTPDKALGGIARWTQLRMLVPRLGYFVGHEDRVPYDIPELLACMAPRPVYVVSPRLDREVRLDDVTTAVKVARKAYRLFHAEAYLEHAIPETYNQFDETVQANVAAWLTSHPTRDGKRSAGP